MPANEAPTKRKDDGGNGHDGEIAEQRLRGRARTAQAGIDERHACDGQRGKQQQRKRQRKNRVAHGGTGDGDRRIHGRFAPRARMCPRTATTRPIASTARPQTTKAVRRRVGKQHQRGKSEKESGWHHQQSGVLHGLSFPGSY